MSEEIRATESCSDGQCASRPKLLDCHTHSHEVGCQAIRSLTYTEWSDDITVEEGQLYSIGFHPWSLPPEGSLVALIDQMQSRLSSTPQIVAVGECGVDKVRSNATLSEQLVWLEVQMRLACQLDRPILLHAVRAWAEMIEIRSQMAQEFAQLPPMVLHGFRARGEVAQMMLSKGFVLSFGRRYDAEALHLAYEAKAILVETDEIPNGLTHREAIEAVYAHLAEQLSITPELLASQVAETSFWQQTLR
ncbi:TatD family hydrolase [uncultured Porphyromonas sp.]|uniref:TatD family hydrolase n=1 Tax=uncultured Porphyromonas sp. TaxID=159274 RepID=UPI00261E02E1|nr:TatD family hydrolase [uncultured Porphyromonas sp.]